MSVKCCKLVVGYRHRRAGIAHAMILSLIRRLFLYSCLLVCSVCICRADWQRPGSDGEQRWNARNWHSLGMLAAVNCILWMLLIFTLTCKFIVKYEWTAMELLANYCILWILLLTHVGSALRRASSFKTHSAVVWKFLSVFSALTLLVGR